MANSPSIAGVVLTLNEAKDLPRALRSLSWCNELFVLDSGSTDSTREIAAEHGARFIEHIQTPPFLITKQRNWALDHCGIKSEWVLFLDADEEIGPQLVEDIQQRISHQANVDAFELTPRYWFLGKWLKRTQGYPNWHPRLLRSGHARFEGSVWETFSANATVAQISTPYEHYAFSKGLDDWIDRHCRYSSWESKKIYEYQTTKSNLAFATNRQLRARQVASYLGIFRPFARFIQKYFFNLGFTEGHQALIFSLLMAFYELMIHVKVIELYRKQKGLPL